MLICLSSLYEVLLLLVLFQIACCAKVPAVYDEPRLPATIRPFHYDIRLTTHLEKSGNHSYNGNVNITLHAQKTTYQVVLHVAGVKIKAKKIRLFGETSNFQLTTVKFNKKRQYMMLKFNQPLRLGKTYILCIEFGRSMSKESEDGYFIRHYVNAKNSEKIWYSISHFDRNFIRNTLPSFDEPGLRATFNVTMGHHKRFQSYSNMNVRAVLPNLDIPDYVWSVHEVTPLLSTHLLALSVNNFTCRFTQEASANPMRFRTCSQSADLRETSFAAQMAPSLLEFLDGLLKVPLPLDKIDQLVVDDSPTEVAGNLGLVIYQSKPILHREDGPMTRSKLQALQLMANGMAHMWFGNLLGNDWWSELWLTEGLAGYFETLAMDDVKRGMGRRLRLRNREASLMYESQVGGLSLELFWPPAGPEVEKHLYQKATNLIGMVNGFLGNATFYDGLQRHLWQNSFASSTADLFWRSLQLASERESSSVAHKNWDVGSIMETWTRQSGYPLVTVIRRGHHIILLQENALNRSRSDLWWIPLTYIVEGEAMPEETRPKAWLSPFTNHLQLDEIVPHSQWILLNLRATGYYRVNYDEHTWQLLAAALLDDFRSIHVLNRAQIVSDILFLRKQELVSWTTALNVLRYIVDEDEYEPLMAFVVGVTNGLWGISPESSLSIAKWLSIAGRWYAEFISYTFDKFVLQDRNLNSLEYPD